MFKIDNKTGQITLVKSLTDDDSGTYTLVLAVQDGGVPQRTTWTNLVVVVGDKADAKNLIIVISVCSVTLFISIGLIITICIIRRHDNKNCNERRVHFEKGDKNLCWKWLKCLSAPTTQTNFINTVERVKDSNKHANQGHYVDTKPIISTSRESFMYDSLEKKVNVHLVLHIATHKLISSNIFLQILFTEVDLTSSYPANFTFVDNNVKMTSHEQTGSRSSLKTSVWEDRRRMPPPHPYQRYISMDEDYLRNPQKRKIYFARFRSNSESESVHQNKDGDSTKSEQSNVNQSNSFKQVDLNNSYSGPFYITSSLERKPNSHYAHPRSQFSPNSSRHATRRQLSTISATPEPVYDPVQELNAISYQDHEDLESSSPPGSRHSNQGQITQNNNIYHYANDIPLSPYDLHVEEKMFNKDVIV
ncbi:hypothetical protein FSP39_014307 [Pinctada imbricata]|uniref:Cadherin domain-containing protein n=1 Tax=Pinctada imbricata TaxID=66713 RepID=A0AA88Y7U3_PINIB|nr:hypothetical protein FSP39_014307 [Pinctada imbricata]